MTPVGNAPLSGPQADGAFLDLDLDVEEETFLRPGVTNQTASPQGTATFTTTCWSCHFTCGDCTPVPSYCNC